MAEGERLQDIRGSLLTCEDLRRVLDQFAHESLREEFSQLRSQVLGEIRKELRNMRQHDNADPKLRSPHSALRFAAGPGGIMPASPPDSDQATPKAKKKVMFAECTDMTEASDKAHGVQITQTPKPEMGLDMPSIEHHKAISKRSLFESVDQLDTLEDLKKRSRRPSSFLKTSVKEDVKILEENKPHLKRQFAKSKSLLQRSRSTSFLARRRCETVGNFLEGFIVLVIVFNGLFIGVQTDYHAQKLTEEVPTSFKVVEILFFAVFLTELLVKLAVNRVKFYCMVGRMWNVFDTLLVIIQLIEVVGMIAGSGNGDNSDGKGLDLSFMRLLRILKLFRILRLIRLLKFIEELAMIISSIGRSFLSLCWTVLLLLILMYMVGVVLTQIVFTHRVSQDEQPDSDLLKIYWGGVLRSVLSLYQATMAGIDWGQTMEPLEQITPWLSVAFCLYIAFVLLAVMNVITGTFVNSAVKDAEKDKMQDFLFVLENAFKGHDPNRAVCPQWISIEDFAALVEGELAAWFQNMDIKPEDAKLIFYLLDKKQLRRVQTADLMDALCRLREGVKFIDIMNMMYEYERYSHIFQGMLGDVIPKSNCRNGEMNPVGSERKSALSTFGRSVDMIPTKVAPAPPTHEDEVLPITTPSTIAFGVAHHICKEAEGHTSRMSAWEVEEVEVLTEPDA